MKKSLFSLFLTLFLLLSACGHPGTTLPACHHADSDDNGRCDSCSTSLLVTLDIYTINDLHGKLADGENHPGVDELTTFLKTMQARENTIFLSAGDMWQGSAESNLTQGQIITDWMNELNFAAMTLGNHEFDWGKEAIEANAAMAQFPFLAINIYDRATDAPVNYCAPSTVVQIQGLQIGIIGAMGDCYSSIASDKTKDIYFVTGDKLTELVKAEAQRLRQEDGVDFIIYSIHDGFDSSGKTFFSESELNSYYDLSLSDGYVDLVFEGHTHQKYSASDPHGVYHLQHKGDNSGGISHAEIRINSVTGSHTVTQADLISTSTYSSLTDDSLVQELLDRYADQIAIANQVVGYNSRYRSSKVLCSLVADLYYQLGLEVWGGNFPITLGGGFLSTRSPYDLEAGQVTYGQLQSLFPFDNDIVLCSVKGQDLLDKFIHSSNSKYYISGTWGKIDPTATYYIVVDSYTATYAPNRLTIIDSYQPGIYARDLLAKFISKGGLE